MSDRTCPECASPIVGKGRGMGKLFCSKVCRVAYHNRAYSQAGVLASLTKAWNATRHASPGSREAEICRYARSEITRIARILNDADKAMRRPDAASYVEKLMQSGSMYMDRRTKQPATPVLSESPSASPPLEVA